MKVIVLRAAIVGMTSTYRLAKAEHEVTVIERQPRAALKTSFANAGEVSFGHCSPWAAPRIPLRAVKRLFTHHAPRILRPEVDMAVLSWVAKVLRNCISARYALNESRMLRVAGQASASRSFS